MRSFLQQCELALSDVAAGQRVPIPLFPIGEWKSAKYPSLPLTRQLADELVANFESGVLGTEPVLDSSGKHDTSSPAAGWFKRLYVAPTKDGGEMLFGDAELTDLGAEQLNAGLYRYDSIELGPVVDNETGAKTDNVFRSATLTNTPVLRMLPPVLDAAGVIAASEAVEVALSEVTAAEQTVPQQAEGASHEPGSADSESVPPGEGTEGTPAALSDGAATEGGEVMKTVALKLNLAEDAAESVILAEVERVVGERDAAVTALAEREQADRTREFEDLLGKALAEDGQRRLHMLPGEADIYRKLAEADHGAAMAAVQARIDGPAVLQLGEAGSGSEGESFDASADVTVEVDKAAKKLAEERGIGYGPALVAVLAEDPALAERYASREV